MRTTGIEHHAKDRGKRRTSIWLVLLHCLVVICLSSLIEAQEVDADDDIQPEGTNVTEEPENILPTVITTNSPTTRPFTEQPTPQPTRTWSPSSSPTVSPQPTTSPAPSSSPTFSMAPSSTPSLAPSTSMMPSSIPSMVPTVLVPTVSPRPTLSAQPSMQPSTSHAPTLSPAPTGSPTEAPPSPSPIGPTFQPTLNPSAHPTPVPSDAPSFSPSLLPTFRTQRAHESHVYMTLNNFPRELTQDEMRRWTTITQTHILNYYERIHEEVPDTFPFFLTSVTLFFSHQVHTPGPDGRGGRGRLVIDYFHGMVFGTLGDAENVDWDEVTKELISKPFEYDAISYVVELMKAFDLDGWIDFRGIIVGETDAPTSAPTPEPPEQPRRLSTRAMRSISACIVLAAILIVAVLFYDRHRKEKMYLQTHAQDLENMEYDNAGQAGDWRNPFGSMNSAPARAGTAPSPATAAVPASDRPQPQDRGTLGTTRTSRSDSPRTATPTVVPAPSSSNTSQHQRVPSLPARLPHHRSSGNRTSSGGGFSTPNHNRNHDRHVSAANTDITDITFNEVENRSERSGDDVRLMLPTISDERYHNDRATPWSALHIPEEESSVPSSRKGTTGSGDRRRAQMGRNRDPSMSGFQLDIQDIE